MQGVSQLLNRIKNLLCRGVLQRVDDSEGVQLIQTSLLADEVRSNIEHPTEYGFTSKSLPGAQTLNIFYAGNRDNGSVVTIYDERFRVKDLGDGEVCIYNHEGTKILLKNGNQIEIIATSQVTITSPLVQINGNLVVTGNISDSVRSMQDDRNLYNVHTHGGGPPPIPTQ